MDRQPLDVLRIGFVGADFIANFHLDALIAVRNLRVAGVWSLGETRRAALSEKANALGLGNLLAGQPVAALRQGGEGGVNHAGASPGSAPNTLKRAGMKAPQITAGSRMPSKATISHTAVVAAANASVTRARFQSWGGLSETVFK